MPTKKKTTPRERKSPEVRKAQLINAAAAMIVKQGYLPLPIEQLAKRTGVSKALVYTYFPDQYALFNQLLERELNALLAGGLELASQIKDAEQAALLCGTLYFEHVARHGPLLHILTTDRFMTKLVDRRLINSRDTVLQRLAHTARQTFKLSKAEIPAAIEMMLAIPEESGRLAFTQELDINVARQLCGTLLGSAIEALRAPDRALRGLVKTDHVA